MRILILSQYFWPENFRVNDAARELSARGHEVTVLTGIPNYPGGEVYADYAQRPDHYAQLDNVKIVRVPMLARGKGKVRLAANYLSFALSASTLGAIKLRKHRFDVILAFQVSPATIGLPAVMLRRLKAAPLVYWVQDLWPESLVISGLTAPLLIKGVERFVRWVYRHCDHILGQSHAFVARISAWAPATVPVSYLPNWSVGPATNPGAARTCSKATFDIYFLGNLGLAQDLPAVMGAVSRLSWRHDIHWHFVGDGRMSDWLRGAIRDRGADAVVHLHGAFPPEELQQFYDDADALLVSLKPDPLFAMTIPSKVQSYLRSGRPIVAMLDGEGAHIIAEAGAGLVTPAGDADALAAAVLRLTAMTPARRNAMGEAGRRYGDKHFKLADLVGELEAILAATPTRMNRGKHGHRLSS